MSDSRLSFGSGIYIDVGLKVFEVRSSIKDARTGNTRESILGLAFAGSAIHAMLVKDKLNSLLRHITVNPISGEDSMDAVSEMVENFLRGIGERFVASGLPTESVLFLAGFCPLQGITRVFEIEYNQSSGTRRQERAGDGCYAIGSGRASFDLEWQSKRHRNPYRALREVIDKQLDPGVGGAIQCGHFEGSNFMLKGIVMSDDNKHLPGVFVAGEQVYGNTLFGSSYIPTGQFLAPFKD